MLRESLGLIFTAALGLLVLLVSLPLLAEEPEATLITLEVRVADMSPVTITVPQDEVATLSFANTDFKIGLAPRRTAQEKITLDTLVLYSHSPIEFLDTLDFQSGRIATSSALPVMVTARILEVRQLAGSPLAGGPNEASSGVGITNLHSSLLQKEYRCCVTCGNITACGCAVSMSCGSCCSGPCC